MAYGPLSIANPEQITDDPNTYRKPKGDLRGLPTALVYSTKVTRPLTPVHALMEKDEITDERLRAAVDFLFEALTFRPPTDAESDEYVELVRSTVEKVGREDGVFMGLSAIFLDRDALFRPELAETGAPDEHGRVMLQDWELGLAVNHALRYIKPDPPLRQAIVEGRMRTRDDVDREIARMLADPAIRKPRVLRFFRDFFDHDLGGYICKDEAALRRTGVAGGNNHYRAMFDATASSDRLIELILAEDKDVLRELLTTRRAVVSGKDNIYFGRLRSPAERKAAIAERNKAQEEQVRKAEAELADLKAAVAALEAALRESPEDRETRRAFAKEKKFLSAAEKRIKNLGRAKSGNLDIAPAKLSGPRVWARVSHRSFGNGSMKPERTLATLPEGERMGVLTHPSWLVSHSDAMDNHAILRGPLDPRTAARRRRSGRAHHRRRHAAGRAQRDPAGTHAGHTRGILLDLPRNHGPAGAALRDVQPRRGVPDHRTGQGRRHPRRNRRFGRPRPRRPGRRRPRFDPQARRERTRRASLRPSRLPLLDGPQRDAQRRAGAAGRPPRVPRQRRQHEGPDPVAGDLRRLHVPARGALNRPRSVQLATAGFM